jgi:hypothetical protein
VPPGHLAGLFFSPTITTSITSCGDDASPHRAVSFEQINNKKKSTKHTMSDKRTFDEKHNQPQCYEIRLKGYLDARRVEWFEGLTITLEENGNTLLSGPVVDQAALHGLLKKIRDLSLTLLSVNPVEPGQADQSDIKS